MDEQAEKIEVKLLNIIVDRDRAEKIIHSLEKLDVNVIHAFYGSGTAPNELLSILGLMTEKVIITCTVRKENLAEVYDCLQSEYKFAERGMGIAFTIPLVAVSGLASLRFVAGEKKVEEPKKKLRLGKKKERHNERKL